jgi:DNA-binding SARP family transcriptional activator
LPTIKSTTAQTGRHERNGGPRQPGEKSGPRGSLELLNGCGIWLGGRPVALPLTSQRLLALLALHEHPVQRTYVAGTLWPDYPEQRSVANLRTALARLPLMAGRLVEVVGRQLRLAAWVSVDIRETSALAQQVIDHDEDVLGVRGLHRRLMVDLLPDWYEDWVLAEQERYRELRLHALEALSEWLTRLGEYGPAIEAGLAAVAGEPLRESARRALIRAYLAEGNQAAAVIQYRRFHSLLDRELGLTPSRSLSTLVSVGAEPAPA